MHFTLQKWGFGPHFLQWVSALYNKPKAYIRYAGYKSDTFNIGRGTSQGCPLSPLLFALLIEPLEQHIRIKPSFTSIELGGYQHKLCLFVDDILLFLSSQQVSAPILMIILNRFASISGFIVNVQKSTALYISLTDAELLMVQVTFPFTWAPHRLPYLGIQLTANISDLFAANYPALLKQIMNLLLRWSSIQISWFGKINIIKMVILPNFLYLFRVLLISVLAHF